MPGKKLDGPLVKKCRYCGTTYNYNGNSPRPQIGLCRNCDKITVWDVVPAPQIQYD